MYHQRTEYFPPIARIQDKRRSSSMNGKFRFGMVLAALFVLGMMVQTAWAQSAAQATASIKDASGKTLGTATLVQQAGGVGIDVKVSGLPAGKHGIHLHAVGKCDGPDFATAGGHFNPESKQHGAQNPAGPHAGDLPNLTVAADGTGAFSGVDTRVTLAAGPANSLFDADGTAIVIHAGEDDEKTDPAGNSGARIACGIVTAASTLPATGADSVSLMSVIVAVLVVSGASLFVAGQWFRRRA
jgi:Cu-Zn family superoxide dismutase